MEAPWIFAIYQAQEPIWIYLALVLYVVCKCLQTNLSYVLVVALRGEVGPSTRVLNDSMILCYIVFSETFLHFLQTGLILSATCLQTSIHHSPWQVEKAAPVPSPLTGSQATA